MSSVLKDSRPRAIWSGRWPSSETSPSEQPGPIGPPPSATSSENRPKDAHDMTALTIEPPSLTTFQPSPELWRLLVTGPRENIAQIAQTPALLAQCSSALRSLEVICEGSGDRVVMGALAPLVIVFGKGQEAESPAFWKVYTEALGDLPRIALDRAVKEYQRTGRFFPKPAEIRDLAEPHARGFRQAAARVRAAMEKPEPPAPIEDRPSPEEVAEVMARFKAAMADKDPLAKIKAKGSRPTPSARVDETGVSEEMRQLLSRNAA